jgi:hypothetical protein
VHFSRTGSADRSATARPCRPATAFDFRQPLARGRAREGKCWRIAEHGKRADGIVKSIIVTQQYGGVIEVDSRVDEFTEFTIRLPRGAVGDPV